VPTRICIVGCGAIGGLYAAHLAQLPDVEVWAYDTSEDQVATINQHGLRITGSVELVGRVQARTDAGAIPPCSIGILATKGTVTEPAIKATAQLFADGVVCSVQNGIGNEEIIAERVPRVMRGITLPAVQLLEPGVIHLHAPGPTWIGPFEPKPATTEQITELAALLNSCGMQTSALADARGAQWTKLLFNCSTNPLCALTGLTHGQLCEHAPSRRLAGALIEEGRAVATALGITLEDDPAVLIDTAGKTNFNHRPSMLQDVSARRRTEIQTLNGGIVSQAAQLGLQAPLNAAIVELILGLEHSWAL